MQKMKQTRSAITTESWNVLEMFACGLIAIYMHWGLARGVLGKSKLQSAQLLQLISKTAASGDPCVGGTILPKDLS